MILLHNYSPVLQEAQWHDGYRTELWAKWSGFKPLEGPHCVVFLGKTLDSELTVPFSTQVKTGISKFLISGKRSTKTGIHCKL